MEKYGMSDCKPAQTPLPPKLALSHSMAPHSQEEKDFWYVKGTSDHKLSYRGDLTGSEPFVTYTDAS